MQGRWLQLVQVGCSVLCARAESKVRRMVLGVAAALKRSCGVKLHAFRWLDERTATRAAAALQT